MRTFSFVTHIHDNCIIGNFLTLPSYIHYFHTDVDECNDGSNNCDANADCSDTVGNYTCTCRTGFSGDGRDCTSE